MDAASLADFNAYKASVVVESSPVELEFTQERGRHYSAAFSHISDDGGLHESGQAMQRHRTAALYWLLARGHEPDTGCTFRIIRCRHDPSLVGTRWKILTPHRAANEALVKFDCVQEL